MPGLRTSALASVTNERSPDRLRTRVIREPPGEARWELWLRAPHPALAGKVAGLWAGDAEAPTAHHRALPNGELWAMFNLGPAQRVTGLAGADDGRILRAAFVAGLQDRPLAYDSVDGHPRVVCIRFLPLGAFAFFGGLSLAELANQVLDLDAVLGARTGVEPLRQRMAETPDLGTALDVVEEWLVARLVAGPSPHPVTRTAIGILQETGGDARVASLAGTVGVSPRYLGGLFRREVGLSAKGMARILRFERALEALGASGGRDLAGIAHDCGYYDQPHLNRDFRELAGLTPTEYLERLFVAPGWREVRG